MRKLPRLIQRMIEKEHVDRLDEMDLKKIRLVKRRRYFDRRSRRALDARAVLVEADVLMAELADIRRGAVDDKGNETCFFRRVFHLFYETAARRAVYAALRIDEVILQRCRAVEIFRQIGTAFEPRRELAGGEIGSQHSRFSHKISGVWEL